MISDARGRTIALVGLMGAGKSTVGRRLAQQLHMPFRDADTEIEAAAGRSVIARLLDEPPHVLATGGGAFIDDDTRALINERAVSVWLKADVEVLARRVARRDTRPLLVGKDPLEVLRAHAATRYDIYAQAHITVETGESAHQMAVDAIIAALASHAVAPT